jgi:uncharacterized protein (DUF934 family)
MGDQLEWMFAGVSVRRKRQHPTGDVARKSRTPLKPTRAPSGVVVWHKQDPRQAVDEYLVAAAFPTFADGRGSMSAFRRIPD